MTKSSPATVNRYWRATNANPWPSSSRNCCRLATSASSSSRSATRWVRFRKSNTYGSLTSCWARSESGAGSWVAKLVSAAPVRPEGVGLDLVEQDGPGPATGGCLGGVPVPVRALVEFVEQHGHVTPGQLSNRLLDNLCLRPGGRHLPHVVQVAAREPGHLRELDSKVLSQPIDDLRSPPVDGLTVQDGVPDRPVQPEQLGVDQAVGLDLCGTDPPFERDKDLGVVIRERDAASCHGGKCAGQAGNRVVLSGGRPASSRRAWPTRRRSQEGCPG